MKVKEIKVEWCENWIRKQFERLPFENGGIEVNLLWELAEKSGLWILGTYGSPMSEALEKLTVVENVSQDGKFLYSVFKMAKKENDTAGQPAAGTDREMDKAYFDEIKARFIKAAIRTNDNAKSKDVNRNHVNYGNLTAWGTIFRDFGHKTDIPVWEDENGCLRIPFLKLDGEKIITFEK